MDTILKKKYNIDINNDVDFTRSACCIREEEQQQKNNLIMKKLRENDPIAKKLNIRMNSIVTLPSHLHSSDCEHFQKQQGNSSKTNKEIEKKKQEEIDQEEFDEGFDSDEDDEFFRNYCKEKISNLKVSSPPPLTTSTEQEEVGLVDKEINNSDDDDRVYNKCSKPGCTRTYNHTHITQKQ